MIEENIWDLVEHEAAKSPCNKRKVGCIITDIDGEVVSNGYNFNQKQYECEDLEGNTLDDVMHAEIAAIMGLEGTEHRPLTAWVNHQPCDTCQEALSRAGVGRVEVRATAVKWPDEAPTSSQNREKSAEIKDDPINPKHYSGLEVYQAAAKNYDAYQGFLHLNAFKYIERMWHKENPAQDLKKSMWYLDKLKDTM